LFPYTHNSATLARRIASHAALGCALVAALAVAQPACAALGGAPMATPQGATVSTLSAAAAAVAAQGNASGVARQATQATASSGTSSTSTAYTVQQTTLANGTVVREYLSTGGTVFGVAWSGPQPPDLATLLGGYFPQYVAGVKANHAAGLVRGPGAVEGSGLVVHAGGHMGAFSGQAWLPQALPAGVSASDIQ
jgi:hypothetical protein